MRKILLSLLTVSAVAVVAVVATGAFFNDVETSQDNTFTAGKLDLQVDNTTTYYQNDVLVNGYPQSWPLKDLVGEKFFNFLDVKPEDYGENTISLHVFNNDAWAGGIRHLVNEILEIERRLTSSITQSSPYNFELHNLDYDSVSILQNSQLQKIKLFLPQ